MCFFACKSIWTWCEIEKEETQGKDRNFAIKNRPDLIGKKEKKLVKLLYIVHIATPTTKKKLIQAKSKKLNILFVLKQSFCGWLQSLPKWNILDWFLPPNACFRLDNTLLVDRWYSMTFSLKMLPMNMILIFNPCSNVCLKLCALNLYPPLTFN